MGVSWLLISNAWRRALGASASRFGKVSRDMVRAPGERVDQPGTSMKQAENDKKRMFSPWFHYSFTMA